MRAENRLGIGPRADEGDGPVVSLTSHGERLRLSFLTVESVLRGSVRPRAMYLWLARNETAEAQVPPQLRRLERRGLQVRWANTNFRPGNKLVHTLQVHPDAPIVVCDDDEIYPGGWLKGLWADYRVRPGFVTCYRAHTLRLDGPRSLASYRDGFEAAGMAGARSMSLLATGVLGVLYPPGSLHPDVQDHETYMELSPTVDDVWFKVMSMRAGAETRQIAGGVGPMIREVRGSQRHSLARRNHAENLNDRALQALFERYDLFHLLGDPPDDKATL